MVRLLTDVGRTVADPTMGRALECFVVSCDAHGLVTGYLRCCSMASISFLDVPLVEVLIVRGGAVPSGFSLPLWQSTRLLLPRGGFASSVKDGARLSCCCQPSVPGWGASGAGLSCPEA